MKPFARSLCLGLKVASIYAVVGAAWIAFSDGVVQSITSDPVALTRLQTVKGWAFVALSAVLILVLSSRAVAREQVTGQSLREVDAKFRATFRQAAVGMAHVGLDGRWQMVNDRLCEIVGHSSDQLLGRTFRDITHPDDVEADDRAVARMLAGGADSCVVEKRYIRPDGSPVWVLLTANLVRDAAGHPCFYIAAIQDIESRKRAEALLQVALKEKEVLLAEIHHRVRNNLQLVVSTLVLESTKMHDVQARTALDEALARVQAIALVHHHLYESGDFSHIDFAAYARDLCHSLAVAAIPERVVLDLEMDSFECEAGRVIPMGMILVELVTNAVKHAFPDGRPGVISVRLARRPHDCIALQVADNGVGMVVGRAEGSTSGLALVRMLTGQLDGRMAEAPVQGGGASFLVEIGCGRCPAGALCEM